MKIRAKTNITNWKDLDIGQLFQDENGDIFMVLGESGCSHKLVHWSINGPFLGQFSEGHVEVHKLLSFEEVNITN